MTAFVASGGASLAEVCDKPKSGHVTIFGAELKFSSHMVKQTHGCI